MQSLYKQPKCFTEWINLHQKNTPRTVWHLFIQTHFWWIITMIVSSVFRGSCSLELQDSLWIKRFGGSLSDCRAQIQTGTAIWDLLTYDRHSPWAGWACITNWVDHVTDGGIQAQRPCASSLHPISFRWLSKQAMSLNRTAKTSAPVPGRPCRLYATIFHRTAGNIMRNKQD